METRRIYAKGDGNELAIRNAEEAPCDIRAVHGRAIAFHHLAADEPARYAALQELENPPWVEPGQVAPRERKDAGRHVVGGEQRIAELAPQPRGLQRRPADMREGLHDIRPNLAKGKRDVLHPDPAIGAAIVEQVQLDAFDRRGAFLARLPEEGGIDVLEALHIMIGRQARRDVVDLSPFRTNSWRCRWAHRPFVGNHLVEDRHAQRTVGAAASVSAPFMRGRRQAKPDLPVRNHIRSPWRKRRKARSLRRVARRRPRGYPGLSPDTCHDGTRRARTAA